MSSIRIQDLTESIDLDREAMIAIFGGARLRHAQPVLDRMSQRVSRIFNFPADPTGKPLRGGQGWSPTST